MYKNNLIIRLTKTLVDVLFYLGIVCCISVPFLTPRVLGFLHLNSSLNRPTIFTLIISGICAVYILFQLRKMFKTVVTQSPFVIENALALQKMSIASFLIALIYFIKCFYWFTFATVIIVIVFLIAGLFCLTLKDIFTQAVQYKEDNDLTI